MRQPTLVLWGRDDEILPCTASVDRFEREIADCQVVLIDNCGHVPHLEQPEETYRQIEAFINSE